jgi:hypothetical protein
MRFALFIFFLFQILNVSGQIHYDFIKEKLFNNNSDSEYKLLLERFKNSDSTLTREDFVDLYYGAVFLNSYDPGKISKVEERIRILNFSNQFIEAYELADSLLQKYPMSIQAYFEKTWACFNLKRFEEEKYNEKRYKILIKTILQMSDGSSPETAYHCNLPNDEFEVIKFLKLEVKEEKEISYNGQTYDLFSFKSNRSKIKELYFNVSKQRR